MRILIVNVGVAEENSERGKLFKTVVAPLIRRNLDLFRKKDTELTLRFPSQGIIDHSRSESNSPSYFNPDFLFHGVLQADREGFDAALIACFHDAPTLKEARPLVGIPVVGIAESSLLMATLTGRKFGFLGVMADPDHPDLERKNGMVRWIAQYDLNKNYVGDKSGCASGAEMVAAHTDSQEVIERVKKAARELIADGAELILTAGGELSPVLQLAPGAEKEYPDGLTEVDGVPIMNSLGNALKMAEMLVESKQAGFLPNRHKKVSAQTTSHADDLSGYWDC